MHQYKFTVITPVYNRAHTIQRTYESILRQDYDRNKFEWLIINDGSNDNIKDIVKVFIKDNLLNIRLIDKSVNEGIHFSVNLAVREALGEYCIRIDSDDVLCDDAILRMDSHLASIPSQRKGEFTGVVGRCLNLETHELCGPLYSQPEMDTTGLELMYKHNDWGDKSFCIRTEVLREFPIPEYTDTKWVPDSIMWNRIDRKYITRYVNTPFSLISLFGDDSITKAMQNKAKSTASYASEYYCHIHRLNETYDYLKTNRKKLAISLIKCVSSGIQSGRKIRHIIVSINKPHVKMLAVILSPVAIALIIRNKINNYRSLRKL